MLNVSYFSEYRQLVLMILLGKHSSEVPAVLTFTKTLYIVFLCFLHYLMFVGVLFRPVYDPANLIIVFVSISSYS